MDFRRFASRATPVRVTAVLAIAFLCGCAAKPQSPMRVVEYTVPPEASEVAPRMSRLEESARRLRAQYEAMGQTLLWIEGELKALREQARVQYKPVTHKEKMTATTAATTTAAAPAAIPTTAQPRSGSAVSRAPVSVAPVAGGVAPLRQDDLTIEPTPTPLTPSPLTPSPLTPATHPTEPPKSANGASSPVQSKKASSEAVYLVHIASYKGYGMEKNGWKQLLNKTPRTLGALTPYTTPLEKDGQTWVRLNAGTFASESEALQKCQEVKDEGGWCDVVKARKDEIAPL